MTTVELAEKLLKSDSQQFVGLIDAHVSEKTNGLIELFQSMTALREKEYGAGQRGLMNVIEDLRKQLHTAQALQFNPLVDNQNHL
jgi:tellurite resistance protein